MQNTTNQNENKALQDIELTTTSASSGIGESASTLAALAGTGDWQEGQRFSSSVDSDEVVAWVTDVLDH